MLPKIIKSGKKINNLQDNFDFPEIPWNELVKSKEERHELMVQEIDLNEEDSTIAKKPLQGNKSEEKKVIEAPVKPSIDLEFIKKEAEKILSNANIKKDEVEKAAYEQGYASGMAIGQEEGKREYFEALSKIGDSISALSKLKENLIREYEPEIIRLAISIAEKILKREVEVKSDHIVEIVSTLVSKLKDKSKVIIKLSTFDYKQLKDSQKLGELKYITSNFEISEDPTILKGDVLIDTSFGIIDASIDSQLKKISEELV